MTNSNKYSGVLINNKHSYKGHTDMIVEKANNCLFSLLKKNQVWREFDPNLTLPYNRLISPILNYGYKIWGIASGKKSKKSPMYICAER